MDEKSTIKLARQQGYREGYLQALGDVVVLVTGALEFSYQAGAGEHARALEHVRALVKGLVPKKARKKR